MKKNIFILTVLMLWCSAQVFALSVKDYTETFSRPMDTSDHAFAPRGWSHIVESYQAYSWSQQYFVSYSQQASGGHNDGAFLRVGSQTLGGSHQVNDLLVTPSLRNNATLSFYVRKSGTASSSLKLFYLAESGSTFSIGNEIPFDLPELTSEWQQVSVNLVADDNVYVGIRIDNLDFDDFYCSRAYPELKYELQIESAMASIPTSIDAAADGSFSIGMSAVLKNIGDYDMMVGEAFAESEEGTEAYTLDLIDHATGSVLFTQDISADLAMDATTTETLTTTLNVGDFASGTLSVDVRENVSGKVFEGPTFTITPYKAIPAITRQGDDSELSTGSIQYFGVSTEAVEKSFTLKNNGAAPMTVENISLPDGYELGSNAVATNEIVVSAHGTQDITVRMEANVAGEHVGAMTIAIAETGGNAVPPLRIVLHGAVPAEGQWYVDFEDNKIPENMISEGGWSVNAPSWRYGLSSGYWAQNAGNTATKFITPLLNVQTGGALSFSAAMRNTSAEVKVYYSADREQWTLLDTFSTTATEEANKISTEDWGYNCYAVKRFTVTGMPAGELYFAFEGKQVYIDDIIGPQLIEKTHDFAFVSKSVPSTGTVNYDSEMMVKVKNATANEEAADAYTLKLIVDGETVAAAEPTTLAAGEEKEFSFVYTPHKSGSQTVTFQVETSDGEVFATEATIDVAPEASVASATLGTANAESSQWPIDVTEGTNVCESIYPAAVVGQDGDVSITSLAWKGHTNYTSALSANITVYMENTDDATYTSPYAVQDTDNMVKVYEGVVSLCPTSSTADRINIKLNTPFAYEAGKSIRILINSENDVLSGIWAMQTRSWWQVDNTLTANTIYGTGSSMSLAESTPVVYFTAEEPANSVSGKATFEADGQPAAGVEVKATSGNVVYETTTAADGTYNLPIYQNEKDYQLTATLTGYMPITKTINVKEGSVVENLVMAPADRIAIIATNFAEKASVNHELTVEATIVNPTTETVSDYTATLYLDGEAVATAEPRLIGPGEETTLTFSCYPHEVGTLPAYVEVVTGDKATQSETVDVVIAEEVGTKLLQVLENKARNNNAISNWNMNKFNLYDWYYTPEQMGIAKGTKIHSLTLRGFSNTTVTMTNKLYMANMTEGSLPSGNPVGDMTLVGSGTTIITKMGSTNATVDLVTIEFDEPFVYDGGYLHLTLATEFSTASPSVNFEMDNSFTKARKANGSQDMTTVENPSWTASQQTIVGYFQVDDFVTVSGTVADKDTKAAIEGAEVKLLSGNVEYSCTTDADGAYSINVIQKDLAYDALITAPAYLMYKESSVALEVHDYQLSKNVTFTAGQMSTVILPVALDASEVAAAGKFYQSTAFNAETQSISYESVTTTEANKPYLFIPAVAEPFDFSTFDIAAAEAGTTTVDEASFVGTYGREHLVSDDVTTYFGFLASTGDYVRVGETKGAWCGQYHAYIAVPTDVVPTAARLTIILDGQEATGIVTIDNGQLTIDNSEDVYDLHGRLVEHSTKGIYIQDGRKVVKK